jgi:hypothetical protein
MKKKRKGGRDGGKPARAGGRKSGAPGKETALPAGRRRVPPPIAVGTPGWGPVLAEI